MFKPSEEPALNTTNKESFVIPESYTTALDLLNENTEISDAVKIEFLKIFRKEAEESFGSLKSRDQDLSDFKNTGIKELTYILANYFGKHFPKIPKRITIERNITWAQKNQIFDEEQRKIAIDQYRKDIDELDLSNEESALFDWWIAITPPTLLKFAGLA